MAARTKYRAVVERRCASLFCLSRVGEKNKKHLLCNVTDEDESKTSFISMQLSPHDEYRHGFGLPLVCLNYEAECISSKTKKSVFKCTT